MRVLTLAGECLGHITLETDLSILVVGQATLIQRMLKIQGQRLPELCWIPVAGESSLRRAGRTDLFIPTNGGR